MNLFNLSDDKEMALAGFLTGLGGGMSRASRGGAGFLGALAEGGQGGFNSMLGFQQMASMQGMRQLQQEQLKRKIAQDDAMRAAFGLPPVTQPGAPQAAPQTPTPAAPQASPAGASPSLFDAATGAPAPAAATPPAGAPQAPAQAPATPPVQPTSAPQNGPGAPRAGGASPLISMLPPEAAQQVQALAAADPHAALELVKTYTTKLLDTGRWKPQQSPQGGGMILVDSNTGRMAPIPLTFAQELMSKRAGATNISMKVEQAGGVKLAELGATEISKASSRIPVVNAQLGELGMMEQALKAYDTGFAGETGLKVKQALEAVGVKTNAAPGEFFQALAVKSRLGDIPPGLGAVSNYEQEMYAKASPGLALTRQGNETLIAAKRAVLQRERQAHDIVMEEAQKNPNDLGRAYMTAMQRVSALGPTFDEGVMSALRNAASGNAANAPQRPGFPGSAPGETPPAAGGRVLRYDPKAGATR